MRGNGSLAPLGSYQEWKHFAMCWRARKDKKKPQTKRLRSNKLVLVPWEELGRGCVRCNGWCSVLTNSALWWEGEWVLRAFFYQMRERKWTKISWHGALICSRLSPPSRVFICGGWWASSSPAKLSSQMGGRFPRSPLPRPLKSQSFLPLFLCCAFCSDSQTQPTDSAWLQRESRSRRTRGETLREEPLVQKTPLMSHGDSGYRSLGARPETGPAEPIQVRGERAKRITGNCIRNGPSRKRKKWKETEMKKKKTKQLYLESAGTKSS